MGLVRTTATSVAVVLLCNRPLAAQLRSSDAPAPSRAADSLHLSRRQAIAEALTRNAQLEIAREQTAQAKARRASAIAVPDPSFSAALDQATNPLSAGTSRPVSLGLDIPYPTKFRLNSRIGLADIGANEANYRLQQQSVVLQASATYDSLLVALMHRANLRDAQTLAEDFLKRTQIRFEAGAVAKLDVIQATLAVAQAQNDLIANDRDVANAQASLNRVLGRIIGASIAPSDSLDVPAALPDSAAIERLALLNRPELAILENQQLGAQAQTGLARAFWLPDLNLAIGRDYAQPGSPLFTTGFTLPLPVFLGQHRRGDIAQAQHFEAELAATYRDARAQVTQDVRSAYANASTALRQVVFIRDNLLPAAQDAYRISLNSYSLGGSSALEVLTARSALLQAQSQLIDALAAANTARADLDRALGISVPSPSGAPNR